MAIRAVTLTELPHSGPQRGWIAQWTGLLNGDTGEPLQLHDYADMSMQVTGTFGAGGSVAAEGSNDATTTLNGTYNALRDPGGTTIALTAASLKTILEKSRWLQPHVTAGDGTTALVVTMFFRKTGPL